MATKPSLDLIGFISAKKGEASPTTVTTPPASPETPPTADFEPLPIVSQVRGQENAPEPSASAGVNAKPASVPSAEQPQRLPAGQQYHKALTLKLDEHRYKALKMAGLMRGATSQDILVEALDLWLEKTGNAV